MKVGNHGGAMIVVFFAVWLAAIGGWCANIYKIISTGFEVAQWGGMEIARCIGVFVAPLGAVLGYF